MDPTGFRLYSRAQIPRRSFDSAAARLVYAGAEVGHDEKTRDHLSILEVHWHQEAGNADRFIVQLGADLFSIRDLIIKKELFLNWRH